MKHKGNPNINGNTHGQGFKKGRSGNPGGRPKGLAALIRARTQDGQELVDLMLKIMRGELPVERTYIRDGEEYTVLEKPSLRDRMQAAEWLAERGFGKVTEHFALQNPDGTAFSQLVIRVTQEELPKPKQLNAISAPLGIPERL
jgi:hypothetical protein